MPLKQVLNTRKHKDALIFGREKDPKKKEHEKCASRIFNFNACRSPV